MNAQELRIGNLVHNRADNIVEVKEINSRMITGQVGAIVSSYGLTTQIKFIPLTKVWLLKFGFGQYKGEDDTYQRYIDVDNGFTTIEYFLGDGTVGIDIMSIKCKYVHQLQNLYFALTGSELTLK